MKRSDLAIGHLPVNEMNTSPFETYLGTKGLSYRTLTLQGLIDLEQEISESKIKGVGQKTIAILLQLIDDAKKI